MVSEPDKEIRFTRSRQAIALLLVFSISTVILIIGVTFSLLPEPYGNKELIRFWYILPPLIALSYFSLRLALHCIKHAYLIFTPMGLEILPLRHPEKNLNLIYWHQINTFDVNKNAIVLHYNTQKTAGTVISLKPIHRKYHSFINKSLTRRVSKNYNTS